MRFLLVLWIAFLLASGCDSTPGPVPLGQRPPVLDDFRFFPNRLVYALLPPEQIVDDSVRVPITISVTARGQGAGISEVWYVVQSPAVVTEPLESGLLPPSGNGRYGGTVTVTLSALTIRTYTILVYAVDEAGRISGDMRGSLHYFREFTPGAPPVIDSLAVPDTLQRPAAGQPAATLLLVAQVSDPDGLNDIALVEFWNESTPATRLLMCDDGGATSCGASQDSGDMVASDGFFTRRVFITSSNRTGTNTLIFQATDRAGLESDTLAHDVVIQ